MDHFQRAISVSPKRRLILSRQSIRTGLKAVSQLAGGFLLAGNVFGQGAAGTPNPPQHPCGDATTVSSYYFAYDAEVEAVASCDTLSTRITYSPGRSGGPRTAVFTVKLAGIQTHPADSEEACASWLSERLIGTSVKLHANDFIEDGNRDSPVVAQVQAGGVTVNQELLVRGLARFETEAPYEVNWFVRCECEMAESEAKQQRKGLWSSVY